MHSHGLKFHMVHEWRLRDTAAFVCWWLTSLWDYKVTMYQVLLCLASICVCPLSYQHNACLGFRCDVPLLWQLWELHQRWSAQAILEKMLDSMIKCLCHVCILQIRIWQKKTIASSLEHSTSWAQLAEYNVLVKFVCKNGKKKKKKHVRAYTNTGSQVRKPVSENAFV